MPYEIEEIGKMVKKHPVPWAIGLGVAVVGGYLVYRRNAGAGAGTGYITEAYPQLPTGTTSQDIAAGPAAPGDVSATQLQELLNGLGQQRHEDLQQMADLNAQFMQGLAQTLQNYVSQQAAQQPAQQPTQQPTQQPVQQPVQPQAYSVTESDITWAKNVLDLARQGVPILQTLASREQQVLQQAITAMQQQVVQTPSITFSPQGSTYTPYQVSTMHDFAIEENAAISKGYAGTSKAPANLANADMTMTFYPTGHVAFTPRGSTPPPTPSGYPDTALGRALQTANQRASSGWTNQQVSKVTGRTGTVEQQLSGMSASQKLATLRKAGLIQ